MDSSSNSCVCGHYDQRKLNGTKRLQLSLCKKKTEVPEKTAFICSLCSEWFLSESHVIEARDHLYFMVVLEQQHFPKPALTPRISDMLGVCPRAASLGPSASGSTQPDPSANIYSALKPRSDKYVV